MTKNEIISYLLKIKYIIIFFSIFVLFHNFFEQLLTKTIVNVFLDKFQATQLINIFIFILFVYFFIIAFQYVIRTKLIVNSFYKTIIFLLIIIYFYYRFSNDSPWIFYNEKYFFKYLDIFPFFVILIFLLNFFWKKPYHNDIEKTNGFIIEEPIKNEKDDLYGRKVLAKEIATSILSTNTKDTSFSIGIYGDWGSGKTSFLRLIHLYLPPETIYIKYNPWKNFNKESIINNFFDLLSSELSKYYFNIDLLITEYKNEISSIISQKSIFNSLVNNQKNNINNYDLINEALDKINKKIIIEIDDIDRLNYYEVFQVLKLIRNSANFNNIFFLVAFDRKYMINALNKNIDDGERYIEKIFQLEIPLPNYKKSILVDFLIKKLKGIISEEEIKIIKKQELEIPSWASNNKKIKIELLKNSRETIRFINLFSLSYSLLNKNIDIIDLMNLEILRSKYPLIYELLFIDNEEGLLINPNKDFLESIVGQDTLILRQDEQGKDYIIIEYIKEHLQISEQEIDNVTLLLLSLFPTKNNFEENDLSISNPSSFYRYSFYRLLNENISEQEFSNYYKKGEQEFCEFIQKRLNNENYNEIQTKIFRRKNFDSKNSLEKYIVTIFCISRELYKYTIPDYESIIKLINQFEKYEKYYKTKKEYNDFLVENFKKSSSPFDFDLNLLLEIMKSPDNFIINIKDLLNVYIEILSKKISSFNKYDKKTHIYFIKISKIIKNKDSSDHKKILELFKKYIKNDIETFLCNLVLKERKIGDKYQVNIQFIESLFSDIEQFTRFINSIDDLNGKEEFIKFLKLSSKNINDSVFVKYKFIKLKKCNEYNR